LLDYLPDPEEKAAKQQALLASFELVKKADGVARVRTQAEEEELRRALELSSLAGVDRGGRPPLIHGGATAPPRGGMSSSLCGHL
jgi:hypothetical protein